MKLNLENKKVLVTGSTAGIGFDIAKMISAEGARVVLNGRTQARVDKAKEQILLASPGANVEGVVADLSTSGGIEKLVREVPSVDILINNFGVYEARPLADLKALDFRRMLELNVLTGVELSQHYLKGMREKNWGRVLFIASESGVNIPPDMIHYGVSKSAQIALSRGLAETTAGTGVTVNSVLPGPTYSEGISTFLSGVPEVQGKDPELAKAEFVKKLRPSSLLGRFATGEEVASLVTYLASPLSSATNGAALRVEGGLLRGIL